MSTKALDKYHALCFRSTGLSLIIKDFVERGRDTTDLEQGLAVTRAKIELLEFEINDQHSENDSLNQS